MNTDNPSAAARGSGTRDALIQAGIEAFGRDGFDAVSIRRIAESAGANPAMISYHFGGKEGLYAAAVQHIADQIGARMGPIVESVKESLQQEEPTAEASFRGLCRIADGLLTMMTRPESAAWARIILREQQDPSAQFDLLYEGVMGRVLAITAELHAHIRGAARPGAEDRLGVILLVAQVAFFRTNHAAVLRAMGWTEIEDRQRALIRQALFRNYANILGVNHE